MASDPIHSRRYRVLRAAFRAECEENDEPCWLCNQPIDYSVTHEENRDEAFELDHAYPRKKFPELALDPAGFRASHGRCNNDRGDGLVVAELGVNSRQWLALSYA